MEPYGSSGSSGNRAEAERWLLIAEKLLAGRDLVGSKTFAIRARDYGLDAADQILAITDTLIAGEKQINNQHDWYAILQLPRLASDLELIATHYHRLAILLNPHRNRLALADLAMKLVSDAWSVLSNSPRKSLYDNELILSSRLAAAAVGRGQDQDEHHHQHDEHHNHDHQHRNIQEQQHQQEPAARQSPRNKTKDKNVAEETQIEDNHDPNLPFWTACPYCFYMYEYAGVYKDCSLRCPKCERAFCGVKIAAPPPIVGKDSYFCCWGFFPVGVSMSTLDKNQAGVSNWNPFAPMFNGPQSGDRSHEAGDNVNVAGLGNVNSRKEPAPAPRIYIDDQDVYVEISESSEDSEDERDRTRQKKKAKNTKGRGKGSTGKNVKKPIGEKAKNVKVGSGSNVQRGFVNQEAMVPPNVSNAESGWKVAANSAKRQTGKGPKDWGKLDLNVEFNNDVEVPARRMIRAHGAGNGEEDGIEGISFFEGLDEFLNNLPILRGGLQG